MIHPTALIAPGARLADDVDIGPYTVIGEHVEIGAGTTVGAHAVITGHTRIGAHNQIFHFVSLGEAPQDKKYADEPGAEARLIAKVKAGGKGVWGEIPMPPNPQVKPEDLQNIVEWVLGLK